MSCKYKLKSNKHNLNCLSLFEVVEYIKLYDKDNTINKIEITKDTINKEQIKQYYNI